MTEPWLTYLLIAVLVAVAVQQLQTGLRAASRSRREKRRRFASLAPAAASDDLEVLRRRASRLGGSAFGLWLARLYVQSGTSLSPAVLCGMGLGFALLGWLALPVPANGALRVALTAPVAAALVLGWLRTKRERRIRLFAEQLPDVIDVIVRSLRAGHPLAVSLGLVARESPDPAGAEFALVVSEVSYGRSLSEALDGLHQRIGYRELRFFVAATAIAQQTGGNLGEILSRLAHTLRQRFRLSRRVRALSAEGRFSGYALSALPVALFGLIQLASRTYYAEFWATPAAPTVLAVSVGLLAIGNLVIYRLVNFRV